MSEGLSCDSNGTDLSLYLFAGEAERDRWSSFGSLTQENLVIGPNWIASTPGDELALEIKDSLGGD